MNPDVLADRQPIVIARDDDDAFLDVLHSRAHEVWLLRMGTSLEDRPRYTPTTSFETFPLHWPPGHEPAGSPLGAPADPRHTAVADAARALDTVRRLWLDPAGADDAQLRERTPTTLHNARPTWLANAYAALDRAVWAAFGWPTGETPADTPDDTILARLLALNAERAGLGSGRRFPHPGMHPLAQGRRSALPATTAPPTGSRSDRFRPYRLP